MSNGITERQKNKKNLMRLAAQRQLYRDAKNIERFNVFIAVIIPICLSLISYIIRISDKMPFNIPLDTPDIAKFINFAACFLSIFMLLVSTKMKHCKKEKIQVAATIQQEFDIDVFSMEWDEKLFGESINLNSKIARASQKIMNNKKERKDLVNWYRKEVDELPLHEGVLACQRSNFTWDQNLRERYKLFLQFLFWFIILLQILIGVFRDCSLQDFLCNGVLPVLSALTWITETIDGINSDLSFLNSKASPVFSRKKIQMEELYFIQRDIFEYRKSITMIPEWFYNFFKKEDEAHEQRNMRMNDGDM